MEGTADDVAANSAAENVDGSATASPEKRSGRSRKSKNADSAAGGQEPRKPVLSEEQIRKLVLADSMRDLISVLDGR